MEGAIECLQARGYGRTTSRDLAAAAGSNLAAITYHYGSKEELLNQALIEGLRRWGEAIADSAFSAADGDAATVLDHLAREVETSFERNRGLARAFAEALAQANHSRVVRRHLATAYEDLRTLLAARLAGTLPDGDASARDLASGLLAMFDGLLIQWLVDPRRTPRAEDVVDAARAAAAAAAAVAA